MRKSVHILNTTHPGDLTVLQIRKDSTIKDYSLNLTAWPAEFGTHPSGFMGVFYYDGTQVIDTVRNMFSPIGFLRLISVPFDMSAGGRYRGSLPLKHRIPGIIPFHIPEFSGVPCTCSSGAGGSTSM